MGAFWTREQCRPGDLRLVARQTELTDSKSVVRLQWPCRSRRKKSHYREIQEEPRLQVKSGHRVIGSRHGCFRAYGRYQCADAVKHGSATATTAVHLYKIQAIAGRRPEMKTIADWCSLIVTVKTIKAGARGGQLIGGLIPGGSIPASVAATAAKSKVKLTYTNVVYATSAAIHWRAFQEQALGRSFGETGGAIGPASEIFWEIFTKRGLTRLLGNYDIAGLVHEPAGWEALADKLLLI